MKNHKFEFTVVIVIVVLLISLPVFLIKNDKNSINRWMTKNNLVVEDIRYTFFGGPYLHHKNVKIYKVITSSNDVYWVKISLFGNELSKEDESGKYSELKW